MAIDYFDIFIALVWFVCGFAWGWIIFGKTKKVTS